MGQRGEREEVEEIGINHYLHCFHPSSSKLEINRANHLMCHDVKC